MMKKYCKMLFTLAAFAAVTMSAAASSVYYTIFHALDGETMEVFTDGGSATLSLSNDGGESYHTISSFNFDRHGRGVARVYPLNRAPSDALVKLSASFNESVKGQPVDTVVESSVEEFLDSLMSYSRWSWLTYSPVYVSYETLPSITEIAVANTNFTKLVAAVVQEGLAETLDQDGPFTVFAPTDNAFAALGLTDEELLALPNLKEILLYHVLPEALNGDAVAAEQMLETLLCKDVVVTNALDGLFINDAKVIQGNIEASNGIIHVIDAVLLPPKLPNIPETAVGAGIFTNLVAALQATGLDTVLTNEGPFTVFAPTDDAFAALGIPQEDLVADLDALTDILLYHVVDGKLKASDVVAAEYLQTLLGRDVTVSVVDDEVFINDSKVIVKDIKAENGIIHVIDMVLLPSEPNIVGVAEDAGFSTLLTALEIAGLENTLKGNGPFTVFAPTDEAFAELPNWLFNYLVNNPKLLKSILLYHVVADDLSSGEVLGSRRIDTLNGRSLKPRLWGEQAYINNAKILETDIGASNGTIHVIDKVLIPWFRY